MKKQKDFLSGSSEQEFSSSMLLDTYGMSMGIDGLKWVKGKRSLYYRDLGWMLVEYKLIILPINYYLLLFSFLKCKKFEYVSDFARCKKLRTKTDFDLVFVEGSKLETKLQL
jgi:hypothetical protein